MADLSFVPDRDAIDTPIAPQHGAEEGKVKEDKGFFTICSLIILISSTIIVFLFNEVTKRVYFIGNERMLIAHDSNRLRFS